MCFTASRSSTAAGLPGKVYNQTITPPPFCLQCVGHGCGLPFAVLGPTGVEGEATKVNVVLCPNNDAYAREVELPNATVEINLVNTDNEQDKHLSLK